MRLGPDYDAQLVDLIYATVFGEATWMDFLSKLDEALPGGMTGLLYHDANRSQGAIDINSRLPADWAQRYGQHYSKINPWMPAASVRKIGVGVVAEQMLPRDKFVRTEFYNDCFLELELESAVGITIDRQNGRSLLLSTMTTSADADANKAAAERLTRLAPHLSRAFGHFQAGYRNKVIAEVGDAVFDAVDIGMVVVGYAGKPKSISAAASQIMERTQVLRVGLSGAVKLADNEAQRVLNAMLAPDYDGPRMVSMLSGATRICLINVQKDPQAIYFEGPTVVITLEHRDLFTVLNEAHLQSEFAITNTELRILKAIYAGQSVREIADAEHRSQETIRAHLKSLYKKTNTSRQADLVRFAMRWTGR
ncbi:helix-turn-helix transcriptional regulator [Rhizobium sp.]